MSSNLGPHRPFPGLRPYDTEDHAWFFGREEQSLALYRLLDRGRLVAVVGGSGSGKSSVVRAGLLPLLDEETSNPGGRRWHWWALRPGDAPIARLAEALAGPLEAESATNARAIHGAHLERLDFLLRKSSFGLLDALRETRVEAGATPLLLVDQFEEVFRFADLPGTEAARAARREEAAAFVQLLLEATRAVDAPVRVILTMRSDYLGDCARFQGLPEAVTASEFLVPSLTRDQRVQVIRGPLAQAGATIADELVERLVNDSGQEIDQLPVLQHALMRVWSHAAGAPRHLTLAHYEDIGGIASAISRHADELLNDPDLRGRGLAVEQVFRALAELDRHGRGIRRPLPFAQLVEETGVPEADVRVVVDRFRHDDCSFLVPPLIEDRPLTDDDIVDVGHEALIRGWTRITREDRGQRAGWLFDEAADGRTYVALLATAEAGTPGRPASLPFDQVAGRTAWWKARPRTAAWADRYGGDIARVEKLLVDSASALMDWNRARARTKTLSRVGIAGLVLLASLIGVLLAVWSQYQTVAGQRAIAEEQRGVAQEQQNRAEAQRRIAEDALKQVQVEKGLAEESAKDALQARAQWEVAAKSADEQRRLAESRRAEAEAATKRAQAEKARADQATKTAQSRLLVARAFAELSGSLSRALLLSLAAQATTPTVEARDGLFRALQRAQSISAFLEGHRGTVQTVSFSPDGELLVSGSGDKRVILWDPRRRRVLGELTGHQGGVTSTAFTPDGKRLASGSDDGRIVLWEAPFRSGVRRELAGHPDTDTIASIVFSPDGRLLASASREPADRDRDTTRTKRLLLWDWKADDPPIDLAGQTGDVTAIAFSPDGKTLAAGSRGKSGRISLWDLTGDLTAPKPPTHMEGHTADVTAIAFSPDGTRLASGSGDRRVILWDTGRRESLGETFRHEAEVTSIAFSPDGKILASASRDKRIVLWDMAGRRVSREPFVGSQAWAINLAFSPDGRLLATGNSDNQVVLWDLANRHALSDQLFGHGGYLAFSPKGKLLASARDNLVTVWDVPGRKALFKLAEHTDQLRSVAFSPLGRLLASAGYDKRLILWDATSGQAMPGSMLQDDRVVSLAFSPDGTIVAAGGYDNKVTLWDVATQKRLPGALVGHTNAVWAVTFSPDGKTLASGGPDRTIILWDVASRRPLGPPMKRHSDSVRTLAFSADGKTLASGGFDKRILLWDVSRRTEVGELTGHQDGVMNIAFSPTRPLLASGSLDRRVMLWDLTTRKSVGEPLAGHDSPVLSVVFSPDGKLLASSGTDAARVVLWNVDTADWTPIACRIANRNLTRREWDDSVGKDMTYTVLCPEFPVHRE